MIVEGILILTNPELRDLFDIKIFVHADSDETCLEFAAASREVLVFLVSQVSANRSASRSFTDNMKKLLTKKVAKSDA